MTPADLAAKHPRLYHVTAPDAWPDIERRGLLSAARLAALFGHADPDAILRRRRPTEVVLSHPEHGRAVINDNLPLSERALAGCLDDGLTPGDWLAMLAARVFFWADEARVAGLLNAKMNRGRPRLVLTLDTRRLADAHGDRLELSPINSGSTIRRPARRGLSTYTPLAAMSYPNWRRRRGGLDRVVEVTARDAVPDAAAYVVGREVVTASP